MTKHRSERGSIDLGESMAVLSDNAKGETRVKKQRKGKTYEVKRKLEKQKQEMLKVGAKLGP